MFLYFEQHDVQYTIDDVVLLLFQQVLECQNSFAHLFHHRPLIDFEDISKSLPFPTKLTKKFVHTRKKRWSKLFFNVTYANNISTNFTQRISDDADRFHFFIQRNFRWNTKDEMQTNPNKELLFYSARSLLETSNRSKLGKSATCSGKIFNLFPRRFNETNDKRGSNCLSVISTS